LPDEDLQIGVLLALLQDDAKNQSSYLTWGEGRPQPEVAATLRRDFLVTEERADKLSGAWDGIRCWGECISPRTAPAQRRLPSSGELIPRSECSRPSTVATD